MLIYNHHINILNRELIDEFEYLNQDLDMWTKQENEVYQAIV